MNNKLFCYLIKVLILAIIAIVIFIFCQEAIWTQDCVTYQYNFATGERIRNIFDIIESQNNHYFTWNGRYVAHFFCQLFLPLLGRTVFSFFNAGFTVLLILLLLRVSKGQNGGIIRFITMCILALLASDTDYIPPCQIGYIWMGCLSLFVIFLFFEGKNISKNGMFWKIPLLFILSLLAGNGQEAVNVGFAGAFFIFFLMNYRRLSIYQWTLLIGFGVGFILFGLSPANFQRFEDQNVPLMMSILNLFLNLRVTYIFLILLLYKWFTKDLSFKKFYKEHSFFVNAFLIDLIFNLFIGIGVNRQLYGMELCSCILSVYLLRNGSFNKMWMAIFSILTIAIYVLKYNEIVKSQQTYDKLCTAVSERDCDVVFADFPEFSFIVHPTTIMRHGVFLDYILSSIQREMHEDPSGTIRVYPIALKTLMADSVKNQYYEYLPNEYVLMQDRNNPKTFYLEREINVLGLRIPLSPYQVKFNQSSEINTKDYFIIYLPQISPIILNTGISIE